MLHNTIWLHEPDIMTEEMCGTRGGRANRRWPASQTSDGRATVFDVKLDASSARPCLGETVDKAVLRGKESVCSEEFECKQR